MKSQHYASVYAFLWDMCRPYKWHYGVMFIAPILGSLHDFANNYALKLVVDEFSKPIEASAVTLFWPIVLFIFSQVYLDLIWRISDIAEWRSEPYVRQKILTHVYDRVQHAPYEYFQNTPGGSITSKIKGMLDGYDNFWAAMHHDFTPRLANTFVLTITLAVVDVGVFLAVAAWALLFFLVMLKFSRKLDRLSYTAGTHRHAIIGMIGDNIANIFTITNFANRRYELNRLNRYLETTFIPATLKVYRVSFVSNMVAAVLYWVMLIALFLYMIHLRRVGEATSGDLVFVMGITLKMSWELWNVIQKMQDFTKNIGDFKAAFSIMSIPFDEPKELQEHPLVVQKPSISFNHVGFRFPDGKVMFHDLCFSMRAGEKVGLVGLSGAGKSTLVSLLLRNFPVTTGQITIDGQDIATISLDSLRSQVAIIPQDIALFHRSILENIGYGRIGASEQEIIGAARLANIHDHIESLSHKYHGLVGERGIKISGGQRQRIAIARAVLKNAPILILDEATSNLDTHTEHLIQTSLERLIHISNTTVIAIAHRLSTIKSMDRIIVLDKGHIVAQGSHATLLETCDLYRQLWEMQKV